MNEKMPWFRMYNEAIDDEKLRLLAFEDRWHFVAIMCLKSQGVLDENDPLLFRKVAVKMGLDTRTLEEVAKRLHEVGLIDKNTLNPSAWETRQYRSDSSRERQRAYRERQKESLSRHGDVTVTVQDTDTDTDTDKNITPALALGVVVKESIDHSLTFDKFWNAYGKKVGRKETFALWNKLKPTAALLEAMLKAIDGYKGRQPDSKYRKDPVRWLKAEGWNDESEAEDTTPDWVKAIKAEHGLSNNA